MLALAFPGNPRPIIRRVARPVASFLFVTATGITGFVGLCGVGVVEATYWLINPSGIEFHYADSDGPERMTKAFAILVTGGLVVSSVWIGETVLTTAFGEQIRREVKHVRDTSQIDSLENHVVVCGYGLFGETVAAHLRADQTDVVLVEMDESQARTAEDDGLLVVLGDARDETVLSEAGIEDAQTMVTAIDDSNANIQVAIVAEQLNADLHMVVRVGDEMYESLARQAGADTVVIPEVASGQNVAGLL